LRIAIQKGSGIMILTKCGYRCDLCLAYKENIEREDNRKILSEGWFKYFGIEMKPEDIMCEGCVSCDNPKLIDNSCPVRPCVISKGIDNCAHCNDYICDKLMKRIVDYDEKINFDHDNIPFADYKNIVEPYESKKRLDRIREKLKMK